MEYVLVLLSLGMVWWAVNEITEITFGVALVAGACLLAIYARLAQAAHMHRQLVRLLEDLWDTEAEEDEPEAENEPEP